MKVFNLEQVENNSWAYIQSICYHWNKKYIRIPVSFQIIYGDKKNGINAILLKYKILKKR